LIVPIGGRLPQPLAVVELINPLHIELRSNTVGITGRDVNG